jgi:hypothetical protein
MLRPDSRGLAGFIVGLAYIAHFARRPENPSGPVPASLGVGHDGERQ